MAQKQDPLVLRFEEIGLEDVALVGGKNASLGELFSKLRPAGINCLGGFATTSLAFQRFLDQDALREQLGRIFLRLNPDNPEDLAAAGRSARALVMSASLPEALIEQILEGYVGLCTHNAHKCPLAVRSSATAEDLPGASFAGQHESYLNISGSDSLMEAVKKCFASLFTDRAIDYRARNGFDQLGVSLSVGVQRMVNVNEGASGVMFTLDTESGFRNVVIVTGTYGLGEYLVQGEVVPDEWTVFKPALESATQPIIDRKLGSKDKLLLLTADGTQGKPVPEEWRKRFCISDTDVTTLARWACTIEQHYSKRNLHDTPMDVEWAKDGDTGELFIIQARPETVHANEPETTYETFCLDEVSATPIVRGQAVGEKIASGQVKIVLDPRDLGTLQTGDVLVTKSTDPDWEPAMKRVSAILTDEGGRTAHAAIISREIGIPCIVGCGNATELLKNGQTVTVSCAEGLEGRVYEGDLGFSRQTVSLDELPPMDVPLMMNVGDPSKAFATAQIPNAGVGLARMEFIINNSIGIHPMALVRYPKLTSDKATQEIKTRISDEDPKEFFVSRLASGLARIAAAFHPRPVIIRMSDFKTNEYARLIGGEEFEPVEENPMLGFRGASRYYDPRYQEGFALECQALKRVREDMGLTNVKAMIPFCRTVEEGKRVLESMSEAGLSQGQNGLQVYAMCEIPSNVLLAREFLEVFDGFSIGSNDLTQLILGIDRDSGTVAHLFDERNGAVTKMIAEVIDIGRRMGKPVGICGQAPSDYPEFAAWLVERGISSISLNPDSVIRTALKLGEAHVESRTLAAAAP